MELAAIHKLMQRFGIAEPAKTKVPDLFAISHRLEPFNYAVTPEHIFGCQSKTLSATSFPCHSRMQLDEIDVVSL